MVDCSIKSNYDYIEEMRCSSIQCNQCGLNIANCLEYKNNHPDEAINLTQLWANKNIDFVMIQGLVILCPYIEIEKYNYSIGISIDNLSNSDFEIGDILCINGKFFKIVSTNTAVALSNTLKTYNNFKLSQNVLSIIKKDLNTWYENLLCNNNIIVFPKKNVI